MPSESHTWRTRVRAYECDSLGHVNNAWYVAYLQQATAEAWGAVAPVTGRDLVALDYSSGAFLDRSGRPNPPPQVMLEALVRAG